MINAFDKSITEYKQHLKKAIEAINRLGEEFAFIKSILSEIDQRTQKVEELKIETEKVITDDVQINLTQ